jgi:hypothetical protein
MDIDMLSPAEITSSNITIVPVHGAFASVASVPRAVAHLELFRSGVNGYLDAIAAAPDASARDGVIADTRVFVETYSRAPLPAPREPPVPEERCVAIRAGGKQCTRRRKDDTTFCGTHARCTQAGNAVAVTSMNVNDPGTEKVSHTGTERALRAAISPSGIPQFVDDSGEVWCAEDVCAGHTNPRSA